MLAKIGGSLLTNKKAAFAPRYRATLARRLLREAADASPAGGVLVLGAGSFGHPIAKRLGLGRRRIAQAQIPRVLHEIHEAVWPLQRRVASDASRAGLD